MRTKIFLTAALLLGATCAFAADILPAGTTISGSVYDKTDGSALGFATVAVMRPDSTLITGVACDADGRYSIPGLPSGKCVVSYSMMGYSTLTLEADVAGAVMELDAVYLEPESEQIRGAVVSDRVKLVEMKLDKLVMNVSQSSFASGSNALELIKKAPGVTVDKDGNVKLNGKAVSVWIDGRPSHMDGKALEALLRSTNGENIDKFELMEHPSAKYDAEGQGGIINIKTKKNAISGFSGAMGISGGGMYFNENGFDRYPWQESAWANVAMRTAKTNTWVNLYQGIYNMDFVMGSKFSFSDADGHAVEQNAYSLLGNRYKNYNIKIGNDWFINDRNTVGVIFYAPGSSSSLNSVCSTTEHKINGLASQNMESVLANTDFSRQYNINANYTHIFDEASGAELTANFDYYHNSSTANNEQKDEYSIIQPAEASYDASKSIATDNLYDIGSAKVDYQSVIFGKYMLEAGAKWALSTIDGRTVENYTNQFVEGVFQPSATDDRNFSYNEHVAAVYSTFAGQLSPRLSAKLGLRGEYTYALGSWEGAEPRSYFNVFPTLYLGYVASEKAQLYLTYSRRITRPQYGQLDPTKTYIDATTYTVGDPYIEPQYSHEIAMGSGLGRHLSVNLGYNYVNNEIQQLPKYYADGTKCLIWGNYGRQHMAYLALNASAVPLTKWLDWTLSVNGIYTDSYSPEFPDWSNGGWSCQGYTELSFVLPKDWKIDWDAFITSPMKYGIYKMETRFQSDFALKKNLLDGKMTLGLSVNDLFRTGTNNLEMLDPSGATTIHLNQKYNNQKVLLNLSWNFGKAQQTRARKVGNLEEISRIGGGGGNAGVSGGK